MPHLLREGPIVAIVLALTCAALLQATFGARYADLGGAFSPMFFPRIVLSGLLALAALNLVLEMRRGGPGPEVRVLRVAAACVLSVGFLIVMPRLGFFLTGAAFSAALLLLLDIRAPGPLVLVALGVPGALVVLFNHVLTLPLPTSPFSWMF